MKPTEALVLVQVLRAVAALLVLVGHVQAQVRHSAAASGEQWLPLPFIPGGFGVDLFFAISGFIMVVSSRRLFGAPHARRAFLQRRAFRLVPLYWIATLVYLPLIVFGSTPYPGDLFAALLQSLVFMPFAAEGTAAAAVFPLYTLGWSLNYEVFFYLLFAVFIVLPAARAVLVLGASLLVIVFAGWAFVPDSVALRFWSQAIVLEFGLGALIGWFWLGPTRRIGGPAALLLAAGALAVVLVDPLGLAAKLPGASTPNDLTRLFGWGLPAAAVLAAAVFFEKGRQIDTGLWSFMVRLGDCSYSLYLMHPFVLIVSAKLWAALQLQRVLGWELLALVCLAGSVALALLSYRWIEKPATRWLQGRATAARPSAGLQT